jgi:hypothetical protein
MMSGDKKEIREPNPNPIELPLLMEGTTTTPLLPAQEEKPQKK